jgi:hypothetical protein
LVSPRDYFSLSFYSMNSDILEHFRRLPKKWCMSESVIASDLPTNPSALFVNHGSDCLIMSSCWIWAFSCDSYRVPRLIHERNHCRNQQTEIILSIFRSVISLWETSETWNHLTVSPGIEPRAVTRPNFRR